MAILISVGVDKQMARLQRALKFVCVAVFLAGMETILFPAMGQAQSYGAPPANVGDDGGSGGYGSGGYGSGGGGDAAGLVVRIGQLEEQVRQLNGKVEQLQFANRQLEDRMQKFQQDIEFRFQELSHKGGKALPKRSELMDTPSPSVSPAASVADQLPQAAGTPRSGTHDDAFDPSRDPGAPGAPRVLGGTAPATAPVASAAGAGVAAVSGSGNAAANADDDAPITLLSSPQSSGASGGASNGGGAGIGASGNGASPGTSPAVATSGSVSASRVSTGPAKGGYTTPDGTVIADAQANAPKEEFEIALGFLKQKDYDDAEHSFAAFVAKNPKSRRASDALYYLGETYYLRGRQREAAEQYLKISTNYASSPRAPEALLRLGEALHALGAKEQACATFSEVPRKYPRASAAIKASAQRAAKRAQC
jgi:tol-pal system protein YbgF